MARTNTLSMSPERANTKVPITEQQKSNETARRIRFWLRRVRSDADLIWDATGEMGQYFENDALQSIKRGFLRASIEWISKEIVSGTKSESLETVYRSYTSKFREISQAMVHTKRKEALAVDILRFEGDILHASGDVVLSTLAHVGSLENGTDLLFHFLRQRPDMLLR